MARTISPNQSEINSHFSYVELVIIIIYIKNNVQAIAREREGVQGERPDGQAWSRGYNEAMPRLAKDRPRDIRVTAPKAMFNDAYWPYLNLIERYEVYYGGASSGKSYFVAQKLVLQLSTRPCRNLLLVRHTLAACIASSWNQIQQAIRFLHLEAIWQINEAEKTMTCVAEGYIADGNMIACRGMDDVEKVKSVTFKNGNVTDIWYEEASEEMDRGNLQTLDERLRGGDEKKRLIVTFNPIFIEHWLHEWIDKELRHRRCIVLRTTYKDNRFLSQDDIDTLESTKDSDPYHYMVYCLGEWGMQGQTIFNANEVNRRRQFLVEKYRENPPRSVRFAFEWEGARVKRDSISAIDFPAPKHGNDYCFMYRDVQPSHPYVMIVDTAGDGSDYYACHVFDNSTMEQVLTYHSSESVDECVLQIYCIARYYNNALLAIEVNFDMYPTKKMQELGYSNLYTRENSPDSLGSLYSANTGFRTHSGNRQQMISGLIEWVNKGNCVRLNDVGTLSEMLTFVLKFKKRNGQMLPARAEAASGTHDDLVIALAIFLMVRHQQTEECAVAADTLKGFYFDSELEDMVKSKRITRAVANAYRKANGARKELAV